ncbi:MAG: hypothetical protein HKM93_10605 [Desulfobacteraceae bacterium]|nr:hypothetical protein [Desulfobacteraceae bacterium]
MPLTMSLFSPDTAPEDLQPLVLELLSTINRETDALAQLPEEKSESGSKSADMVTLSQIVLTAFSSGAVVALFEILKAYFQRKPSLEIVFKQPGGTQFKLKAEHLSASQVDETLALAREFTGMRP